MKKFITLILVLSLVFTVVGCSAPKNTDGGNGQDTGNVDTPNDGDDNSASDGNRHKVYLITMDQMDQHWVTVDQGAKKAADELGNVDYQWLAPDVKDDAKQIESINNAIAGGAEAMLLAANGPDAVTAVLKEAESEGIKIVYVDSPADFPAVQTLATDNEAAMMFCLTLRRRKPLKYRNTICLYTTLFVEL